MNPSYIINNKKLHNKCDIWLKWMDLTANVSLFKGYINLMDMIKYNLVFQMDREAPLTKHNWMCELSSSPRTKQLPSLHYRGELISILTSPLLICSHILSSCCCTNTPQTFWVFWNSMVEGKKLTQDHLTIIRKTAQSWVIVHSLGRGWKAISAKQLHGPVIQEASPAYRAAGKSYSFLTCQAINPSARRCTSEDKNSNPVKSEPVYLIYLHFKIMS